MQVQTIPRAAVRTGLKAARLPLTAVEAVARRGHPDDEWPPSLLFGRVEAGVKQLAGAILRDDELVTEGRLQEAKTAELRRAATLDAVAEQQRREADAEFEEHRRRDEEQRHQAEQRAEAEKAEAQRKKDEERRQAAARARSREQAAARARAAEEKAVATRQRDARATRVRAERGAVAEERQAVEAKGEALALDDRIKASKAARRAR